MKSLSLETQLSRKIMDIQTEKTALVKVLEQINDVSLIRALQHMVEYALKRDEEYLGVGIDQYNKEIEEAENRIEQGNFVKHEQAVDRIKGWRKKEN